VRRRHLFSHPLFSHARTLSPTHARTLARTHARVLKVQCFFRDFVNNANKEVIEDLFDEECVHVDMVWGSTHPAVGHKGLAHYLDDLRATFPDFHVGVDNLQLAQASLQSLWVRLEGNFTTTRPQATRIISTRWPSSSSTKTGARSRTWRFSERRLRRTGAS